jgi:putative pyrroloquinoline-quinone binding quinoprotein
MNLATCCRFRFVVALSVIIFSTSTSLADWSQFQGGASHNGYVSEPIDAPNLKFTWFVDAPDYSAGPGDRSVAIVGGKVYATMLQGYGFSGPYLVRQIDGKTGHIDWTTPIPANSHDGVSAPSVANGIVYVHHWGHSGSSGSSYPVDYPALVGINVRTGAQLFWTTHSGQWSSGSRPTVYGNSVYAAGGYYGGIDKYSLSGGHLWSGDVNQQYGWIPAADVEHVYVYMGSASASPGPQTGSLYLIDPFTGSKSATILNPNSSGSLRSELQSVVLGNHGDAFALTRNSLPGPGAYSLVCFDVDGKSIRWEKEGYFGGVPSVANDIVAVSNETQLSFFDELTGANLWSWTDGGNITGNVILTDRYAFVNSSNSVHAIDLQTRSSAWSTIGVSGNLALSNGLLIVSNPTGVFAYAVSEPTTFFSVVLAVIIACFYHWRRAGAAGIAGADR